jgi:hypothetical protein
VVTAQSPPPIARLRKPRRSAAFAVRSPFRRFRLTSLRLTVAATPAKRFLKRFLKRFMAVSFLVSSRGDELDARNLVLNRLIAAGKDLFDLVAVLFRRHSSHQPFTSVDAQPRERDYVMVRHRAAVDLERVIPAVVGNLKDFFRKGVGSSSRRARVLLREVAMPLKPKETRTMRRLITAKYANATSGPKPRRAAGSMI